MRRRTSETRRYAHRRSRRRRYYRLGFLAVLLALFALGVALYGYAGLSPSEGTGQSQPAEQSRPEAQSVEQGDSETTLAAEPSQGVDEAWAIAAAQDPSPSLATPGETMRFGRRIALTFDDGPDPVTTPAILDVLRDYDLKATFFIYGVRAQRHPELIERIVSEGHTLANHTYYHRDLTRLSPDLVLKELQGNQAVIDQALGNNSQVTLFRPPCGAPYNTETEKLPMFQNIMREQKMYPVMWNIDPRDWALGDQPDSIVDSVAQSTPEDGGVLLLHDTQPQTAYALPGIIDYYRAANFEFTGVRDLLAEKYGVDAEAIEADPDAPQPGVVSQSGAAGNGVQDDAASLAECLT